VDDRIWADWRCLHRDAARKSPQKGSIAATEPVDF
jgi:hypothetical protein